MVDFGKGGRRNSLSKSYTTDVKLPVAFTQNAPSGSGHLVDAGGQRRASPDSFKRLCMQGMSTSEQTG